MFVLVTALYIFAPMVGLSEPWNLAQLMDWLINLPANTKPDPFDHLFVVLPVFDVRAHEAPTGYDVRSLGGDGAYQST